MTELKNEKKIFWLILIISVVVFAVVLFLSQLPKSETIPWFVPLLPTLNAVLNATCSLLLMSSFYLIKKKKIILHKILNIAAFTLSSLFLFSYIIIHSY